MSCSSCGHTNLNEGPFCESCGALLTRVCASCGTELAASARFCPSCGQQVGDAVSAAAETMGALPAESADTIPAAPETIEGERKQVTVMFVDIVGSMDLAEALDSERWRGLLDRFFALASDSVHSVGGTIDKFTGDGMMALFGRRSPMRITPAARAWRRLSCTHRSRRLRERSPERECGSRSVSG